jgi:hypothetical protein
MARGDLVQKIHPPQETPVQTTSPLPNRVIPLHFPQLPQAGTAVQIPHPRFTTGLYIMHARERPGANNRSLSPPMTTCHATSAETPMGKMSCHCATNATEAFNPPLRAIPPKAVDWFCGDCQALEYTLQPPSHPGFNTGDQRRVQHPCSASATRPLGKLASASIHDDNLRHPDRSYRLTAARS